MTTFEICVVILIIVSLYMKYSSRGPSDSGTKSRAAARNTRVAQGLTKAVSKGLENSHRSTQKFFDELNEIEAKELHAMNQFLEAEDAREAQGAAR